MNSAWAAVLDSSAPQRSRDKQMKPSRGNCFGKGKMVPQRLCDLKSSLEGVNLGKGEPLEKPGKALSQGLAEREDYIKRGWFPRRGEEQML